MDIVNGIEIGVPPTATASNPNATIALLAVLEGMGWELEWAAQIIRNSCFMNQKYLLTSKLVNTHCVCYHYILQQRTRLISHIL